MLEHSAAAAIRVILFLGCLPKSNSQVGNSRQCYDVRNETVCYFQPSDGSEMNWDEADKFCRDRNATLPAILDSDHQRAIEKYLSQLPRMNTRVFYTAGRKSRSLDPNYAWRWVNGKQIRTFCNPTLYDRSSLGCIQHCTHMTPNGIVSCSWYPMPFICQYQESSCRTMANVAYWLHDRRHCFVISKEELHWYEARNKCIEGGGDLAIFEDVDSFVAFSNFTLALKEKTRYEFSIGAQRKWWTWRTTESIDVRYTNWPTTNVYEYFPEDIIGLDCLCLNGSNSFRWARCSCSTGRSFLCQYQTGKIAVNDDNLNGKYKSDPPTDKFSNASRCYEVSGTKVCFFTPKIATRLKFTSASQWCKDHNATLPIIRNKLYQKSLENFLDTISLPIHLLWTAGLRVKPEAWSWINGQPFQESDIGDLPQFASFYFQQRSPETLELKGRLLRSFSYDTIPGYNGSGYICQFSGISCTGNGIRTSGNQCIEINEDAASWYEARNRCIDGGGDLATFENVSDIDKLASLLTFDKSYHIGLENSRWNWFQAGKFGDNAGYTNLKKKFGTDIEFEDWMKSERESCYYGFRRCCNWHQLHTLYDNVLCLCVETLTYKWIPCDCDLTLRFVCQREMQLSEDCDQGLIIAGVEGLIITVLVIVVVALAIQLRRRNEVVANKSKVEMQAKTDDEYTGVNARIEPSPSVYQDLKIYEEVR